IWRRHGRLFPEPRTIASGRLQAADSRARPSRRTPAGVHPAATRTSPVERSENQTTPRRGGHDVRATPPARLRRRPRAGPPLGAPLARCPFGQAGNRGADGSLRLGPEPALSNSRGPGVEKSCPLGLEFEADELNRAPTRLRTPRQD